ncbi:hypothetical protein LOD99_15561 [Oopsacas minuta]|uniref:Transposable element P transposase-like RNase H domain-containing protein n=1 Tax=Oopsacas minuta TaxID=111878 RepID=A0AAV7KAK9_9METZ|nr:hypothetical protein LOD99_15561 [Oopsacas minuta]
MLEKYSELLPQLKFLLCQLENTLIPKIEDCTIVTMVLALKSHLISSKYYSYLQSLKCLIFPHPTTLHSLYGTICLKCELQTYLKTSTANFNNQERNATLHMDEIHVKSEFSYTGGRILGSSTTQNEATNTVLAFMISSLCKKWSTIVRLLPCAKSSAAQILPILHEVIKDIESCNLQIQVICTNNYPLNVNLFKLLSPTSNLETCVPHALGTCRPLYLIFDFVHIIKTVAFQDLQNLFKLEQSSVAKTAHRLTAKSCWPSSLETQNVNLALRIFDDSTSAALTVHGSKYGQVSETAQFISLICKVWKIFNINRPNKDIRLNDELSMPLQSNDIRTPGESSISLKEFLKSFAISEESSDYNIANLDPYNRVYNEEETPIILNTSFIQSLSFISGYCVHSIFKSAFYSKRGITHSSGVRDTEEVSSICSQCLSSLVEEDTLELDVTDPVYGLICSIDRGGLKWPSVPVLEAVGSSTPESKWILVSSISL